MGIEAWVGPIAGAVSATIAMGTVVVKIRSRKRPPRAPRWYTEECDRYRPGLVKKTSKMLLLSTDAPVVTDTVNEALVEWGRELLAMHAPRREDASWQIRRSIHAKLLDYMDAERKEAERNGNQLSEAPTMNWPDLDMANVRAIAQRLPKYKRWDLTCEFWRFREEGLNAQWVLPLG